MAEVKAKLDKINDKVFLVFKWETSKFVASRKSLTECHAEMKCKMLLASIHISLQKKMQIYFLLSQHSF